MDSNFLSILKHHFGGQLGSRLISFIITSLLLRYVSISLIGLINVRMTLLYTTIGFLVREPFRKLCLPLDFSLADAKQYSSFIRIYACAITFACSILWYLFDCPEVEYSSKYSLLILIYAGSALLEVYVEPAVIYTLKTGDNALFSYSQSILTVLQKIIVFGFVIATNVNHVYAFCIAQLMASLIFAGIYLVKSKTTNLNKEGVVTIDTETKKQHMDLLKTLIGHSLNKQLVTNGAGYVMVFTNVLSLEMQGVYDTVDRLGSLVTRIILAPFEEAAFIYFSSHVKRGQLLSSSKIVEQTFFVWLKIIINMGFVVLIFGIPYSSLFMRIYGGSEIVENDGDKMLMVYLVYLLIMAINGITECFACASMGTKEILSHGKMLFASLFLQYFLHIVLSNIIGVYGFIVSNCINSAFRIAYNAHYIMKFVKAPSSYLITLLPSLKLAVMLLGSFIVTLVSSHYLDSFEFLYDLIYVSIGAVLFVIVMAYLHFKENLFKPIFIKDE